MSAVTVGFTYGEEVEAAAYDLYHALVGIGHAPWCAAVEPEKSGLCNCGRLVALSRWENLRSHSGIRRGVCAAGDAHRTPPIAVLPVEGAFRGVVVMMDKVKALEALDGAEDLTIRASMHLHEARYALREGGADMAFDVSDAMDQLEKARALLAEVQGGLRDGTAGRAGTSGQ